MTRLFALLISFSCSTCLFSQTTEELTITKITTEIGGTWRSVPGKNPKAKISEFKMEINTVQPTKTNHLYKMTGSIVGFALEDGYAFYKGDVLVFGYTHTSIVAINPIKEEKEYVTGSIQDGKLTFVSYSPTSSFRILDGSLWERPK
jgi:hypothetical protein